jgi:plasmid replication initiation protein
MSKSVQINYEENGIKRTRELHLINKIDYLSEGQNSLTNISSHEYIDVTVEQEMKPFLLQLSKNFTAYDLRNVTKLSVYSIRLYELLKQYEMIGVRALGVDEIKSMFQVEEQYKLFSDFYRWIVKPSEAEINKHTDLLILDVEKLKEGRKIVALRFKFRAKTDEELSKIRGNPFQSTVFNNLQEPDKVKEIIEVSVTNIEPTEPTENTAQEKLIVELLPVVVTKFGVSFKMFTNLVENHSEEDIRQALMLTEKMIQVGKIENIAGFFVGAVRNHYQDTEQQKKKIEADRMSEMKMKAEQLKRVEEDAKQQKEQAIRSETNRKINLIRLLIQQNSPLVRQGIEELSRGFFKNSYDSTKTIEENLENAMFLGGLMNAIQKIEPSIFL